MAVLFILCLFLGLILGSYFYHYMSYKYRFRLIDKIPGPSCRFMFGNLFDFPRKPEDFWTRVRSFSKSYYPIYRVWGSHIATVNLLCPEDIELILSNAKHNKKSLVYRCLKPWLGTGLLTSSGAKWHSRRKILTTTFHFSILQKFVRIFEEQSDLLVERLKNETSKPYTKVAPFVTQFTLGTICETAMGTRLDSLKKEQNEYVRAIHRMGELVVHRIVRPWLFSDIIYKLTSTFREERALDKILHNFSMTIIKQREANFTSQSSSKKRLAMLDLLILAKLNEKSIDDTGIREEVDTFMFEGHDTTATCLCFTLMLVASHKEVQENIVQELKDIVGDFNRHLTFADLQKLGYLERVLKESLRMYPSVPFIGRVTGEEVQTYTGYTIPANCYVNIHIFDLHYNPEIYPDPHKFDPDRFLPEHTQNRHAYAYLPFSAGPRNCIGQKFAILELKSVLSSILKNFILEPITTPSDISLATDLVLRSVQEIKIKIRPRFQQSTL